MSGRSGYVAVSTPPYARSSFQRPAIAPE